VAEPKTTSNTKPGTTKPGTKQGRQRAQKELEADLETAVAELEKRVDRLRAAYDQYFMGIEKMPPHVQIKDVERRLQDLRKIQIRNTALRFKFQTTLQKYNTYQSYWQRIVRQIEEGTYKRDVRRANERFGSGAQRRGAAKDLEIDVDLDDLMSEDADLDDLLDAPLAAAAADDLDDDARDTLPPDAPMEFDFPEIPRSTRGEAQRLMALDSPDAGIAFVLPQGPIEERPSQKHLARADGKPVLPPVAGPQKSGKTLLPPVAAPPRTMKLGNPGPSAGAAAAPAPAPPQATSTSPSTSKKKSTVPPPRDGLPRPPQKKSVRPGSITNGRPPPKAGDLSDERMRQLYSQYVETKRAQKESTAALSYESLARSLRESSEKLKEKHAGKKVDFEVDVKDGKTILRPVVK
jgi:hypothetical protein